MSLGAISLAMAKNNQAPAVDRGSVIYKALWHAIIEQALQPGTKLPEDAIGEKFGASRTIVRAALARLAAEGLVELRRNRGAAVATPSWNEARDIFDVRIGLNVWWSPSWPAVLRVSRSKRLRTTSMPRSRREATTICCRSGLRPRFISGSPN